MLQGSNDYHNSSKQLISELFLTSHAQCSHVGEDFTLGSHIPLLEVAMILLYAKDLVSCGALHMMCCKIFKHLVALAALIYNGQTNPTYN